MSNKLIFRIYLSLASKFECKSQLQFDFDCLNKCRSECNKLNINEYFFDLIIVVILFSDNLIYLIYSFLFYLIIVKENSRRGLDRATIYTFSNCLIILIYFVNLNIKY